jgi:RNA polymerase subunit RPABC4/transcription elongation factor Spt4
MIRGEISHEAGNADLALLEDLVLGAHRVSSPIVFRAADGGAVEVVNPSGSAFKCESCGNFVIITDPEYTDIECLVCKTAMPAGTNSCPKCGWTYKTD